MTTILREVFFKKGPVSIALVETKQRGITSCEIFLAFAVSKKDDIYELWKVPANRILRAKELLDILKPNEYSAGAIADLWKKMSKDPLEVSFEQSSDSRNSITPVEQSRKVIELMEEMIWLEINPSIDELNEILSSESFDSNLLSTYLENLLREGVSARMIRVRYYPEEEDDRNVALTKLLPTRKNHN